MKWLSESSNMTKASLPSEAVESPSLEIFRTRLGKVLYNLL